MCGRKKSGFLCLAFVVLLIDGASGHAWDQEKMPPGQAKRITHVDRQAAADRAAAVGFTLPGIGTAMMAMPGDAPHYFSHPNYANSPLPGNIVSEWNAFAQEIVQPAPMPGMPMSEISMAKAFVYLSYIQAAVYDALIAIEGGYDPYNLQLTPDPSASREAAVSAAAYNVLIHYFPDEPRLGMKYSASLDTIPEGTAKDAGILIGEQAAAGIIALRSGDILTGTYTPLEPAPGVWEPTKMPDGTVVPPIDPWMADLTPFTFQPPDTFRSIVGVPWNLESSEWAAQMNTVKNFGAVSTVRTTEQTDIAMFWTTNNVIQFNPAYREIAAARGLGLLDTARLMAMGNMVGTDALVACFDTKYYYSFWRPITAIRKADTDNNPETIADPAWVPLVMTPSFPEFVAGHSAFVSAQAEVLAEVLWTEDIDVDLTSAVTGETRHYASVAELRDEVYNARVWAGLHYPGSVALGELLGMTVAQNALETFFGVNPGTDTGQHAAVSGGIRKVLDGLPGLTSDNSNNLGQYIPVAVPDTTTYPGSDYYEIAVVQYREKMHSDLPPTLLRGYVQLSTDEVPGGQFPLANALIDGASAPIPDYAGVTPPHYLGPMIFATKNRPVRILFRNLLPTGIDGDLFIPVDVTVMGAGMGPNLGGMQEDDPQNPMAGMGYDMYGNRIEKNPDCFAENRATLHLHGGISPWISDGTTHQWTTPAGENTSYPKGVSVQNVPDMPDAGPGALTFFYTNQQSARLMFYHDHSWGITRLNVYAGEAAPYIIEDDTEQALLDQGLIPGADSTVVLVVQDKTFVPGEAQLSASDELWDMVRWGGMGNLWLPHVYSPAQNPGDSSGVNQFGRWSYGPWFWPPTTNIDYPPIINPYYDPSCDPEVQWCEPMLMPATPFNSMGMEAFNDTPIVNGTAYPTVTLEPKPYRLRILNAASDRFFNLSLYQADASEVEVALNPDEVWAALSDPAGVFPTPVTGTEGPDWIQIGTEGGFLPAPVVIPPQHITWVTDPTVFNAGNVDQHSLLLGPA
ncbi:MAG: phosphatase PAP2 family protein, partial [Armatimonadetes bacterium]|nr:phosphatase PAP2 family protein [Armatimonadota bacterium]